MSARHCWQQNNLIVTHFMHILLILSLWIMHTVARQQSIGWRIDTDLYFYSGNHESLGLLDFRYKISEICPTEFFKSLFAKRVYDRIKRPKFKNAKNLSSWACHHTFETCYRFTFNSYLTASRHVEIFMLS